MNYIGKEEYDLLYQEQILNKLDSLNDHDVAYLYLVYNKPKFIFYNDDYKTYNIMQIIHTLQRPNFYRDVNNVAINRNYYLQNMWEYIKSDMLAIDENKFFFALARVYSLSWHPYFKRIMEDLCYISTKLLPNEVLDKAEYFAKIKDKILYRRKLNKKEQQVKEVFTFAQICEIVALHGYALTEEQVSSMFVNACIAIEFDPIK